MLWVVVAGTGAPRGAVGAEVVEPFRRRAQPCYVIIAVDVSGSMEKADTPTTDARGRRWTLRDEGQLALLQFLPFVYSDLYVGVCHFSDRVRYALPSEETGPVLPWGGNYLSEAACRNLVRPAEFMSSFKTDIAQSLDWAMTRIQAARRKYGDGPGKVLLLSHGDPRDSSRELAGGGPLLGAGARLAEQNIHVYPIIINDASYRPTVKTGRLSRAERAAEGVMVSLATVTGGRAYRIGPEMGFPDIVMDVFGLGAPLTDDVRISPYDWAVVMVGPAPEAVSVAPAGQGADAPTATWQVDDTLESGSEIRGRTVASEAWPVTIVRRPEGGDSVTRLWKGLWELRPRDGQLDAAVRVYRIPDFLLQLEAAPAFPWWIHQQGQLKVRLLDRHGSRRDVRDSGADGLSIRIQAQTPDEAGSFRAEAGQWTVPAQLYTTEPFTVQTPGSYGLRCELLYSAGDVNVPLLGLSQDLQIHPACVGIDILDAADRTLGELPGASEALALDIEGGRQVYFRAAARGVFNAEPMSGTLHLALLSQPTWGLRKNANDDVATGLLGLPEGEERLRGWADVKVQTPLGVREFRLPDFELVYQPAPMRIDCTFGDSGRALWVGELHRQLLTVSAFPVFERFLDQTRMLFPETVTDARMRTVDLQSGTAQVTGPRGRLVETPKPSGEKGRTLTATYSLESGVPIPQADQCEISVEAAIRNLQGAVRTYAVVDPVADGLFTWTLYQEPRPARSEAVSRVLYSGERVRFSAQWRADQNVSAVRFEIPLPKPNAPFFVDLPVAPGADRASIEQLMPSLDSGQTYPVYVHVTRRPAPDGPVVAIKLRGGQFRAEDRRLILEELLVGTEAARDIACHAWEPVEIPLRIVFSGYLSGDPQHSALIEQFKKRCALAVTSSKGQLREITETIEWTSLVVASAPAGQAVRCTLEGHALYTPENTGRAGIELKTMFPKEGAAQGDSIQHAYGHLAVRDPRLAIGIQRLTPGGEVPVFDSQAWARGTGALFPATAGFSTRLRVRIRIAEGADASPSGSWNVAVRVLHRAASGGQWIIESAEDLELNGRDVLVREMQVSKDGQYALEVVGRSAASGQVLMRLTTPVVMNIQQHEVVSVLTPPAWITPGVVRWPFEYRVTLHREPGDLSDVALAVQFQLPTAEPIWLEASAKVTESQTSQSREVLVRSPDLLPPLGTLRDGAVRFRMSAQGLELLTWEYPNVRVLAPVLERLALGHLQHGREIDAADGKLTWNGSTGLWARPVFRAAPELADQWIRAKTLVYLWPDGGDTLSVAQMPLPLLQPSEGQSEGALAEFGGQVFTIAADEQDQVVEILPRRARWRFWGWPQAAASRRYGLAASAVYRPQGTPAVGADGSMGASAAPGRTMAEWTPVYAVDLVLPRVIPWCWWFLAAGVVYLAVVVVLRLFARRPDRLGLDMRLEEHVAIVEPAAFDSPVAISLHQTTLGIDVELQTRYLISRWEAAGPAAGKLLRPLATVLAPVKVLIRRCLFPRRWAWALIAPKTAGHVQGVRQGLLCVWTNPFARTGRAWSSEVGSFDLPAEGQVKSITLDLPYRMDGVTRKMRVSVKIRKMAPPRANRAAEGPGKSDSELLIQ